MPTRIDVKTPAIKDPKWDKTTAKPGEEIELSVTAANLAGETVGYEVRNSDGHVLAVLKGDGDNKAKWAPTLTPADAVYHAVAVLRGKPATAAGQLAILQRVAITVEDQKLTVKGTKLTITSIDAFFVPKQEKLALKYTLDGEAPAKGRIEVWGERYPTDKPIYFEAFVPAAGADKTWDSWHGGKQPDPDTGGKITEDGPLKDKYLSPEFSPYRVRIIVGPDDDAVKEPFTKGKGLGKVAVAEAQFEVTFQSLQVRLQDQLDEAASDERYKFSQVLAVEPRQPIGVYAAMGRLPNPARTNPNTPAETGRVRIPCVRHTDIADGLSQGSSNAGVPPGGNKCRIADAYTTTSTKYAIDTPIYTRPEIPLEFQLLLKSKTDSNNNSPKFGLFEPAAVGPAILDLMAEEVFPETRFTAGNPANGRPYFRMAATRVKKGAHDTPQRSGTDPILTHWLARFVITDASVVEFDVSAAYSPGTPKTVTDPKYKYTTGQNELVVYLNRARLQLATTDEELDKKQKDYKEVDTKKIKLRKDLTRVDDVLWIARSDHTAAGGDAVADWRSFPLGTNCPVHYGGIRGKEPTADEVGPFLAEYTTARPTSEPVIGAAKPIAPFPYKKDGSKKWIDLDPDNQMDTKKRERVEVHVLTTAVAQLGLAGVIFSPSVVAGDTYAVGARMWARPYARDFGEVGEPPAKPWVEGKTGTLEVWRLNRISESWRFEGTVPDGAVGGRAHPGNGTKMSILNLNSKFGEGFNEWTIDSYQVLALGADYTETGANSIQLQGIGTLAGDEVWIRRSIPDPDPLLAWVGQDADWNGRVVIAADGDVDVATPGAYIVGQNQLKVYYKPKTPNPALDPHLDVDLAVYRAFFNRRYLNNGGGNPPYNAPYARCGGYYAIQTNGDVDNRFARWDHYRVQLPPGIPDGSGAPVTQSRQNLASWKVSQLTPGTPSTTVKTQVQGAITAYNNEVIGPPPGAPRGPGGADSGLGGATIIPIYGGTVNNYVAWAKGQCKRMANDFMDLLIPQLAPADRMRVLRWPDIYFTGGNPVWSSGTPGAMASQSLGIGGYCRGSGQAFFFSIRGQADTFEHEVCHSLHVVHFAAASETNFCWKHHDHAYQGCLLGYNNGNYTVPLPVAAVGGAIVIDTDGAGNRQWLCAKCQMKVRGWNELKLPANWTHPDVF